MKTLKSLLLLLAASLPVPQALAGAEGKVGADSAANPGAATVARTPDTTLVGVWVFCRDPDRKPRTEQMVFADHFQGTIVRPGKPDLPFRYRLAQGRVQGVGKRGEQYIPFNMAFDAGTDELTLVTDPPGRGSTYVRAAKSASAGCTM